MRPLYAKVLAVRSVPRQQIYGALLAEPGRAWTIRELAATLPNVSVEAVTATLHLMLGERLLDQIRHTRGLTLRLNSEGRTVIERITQGWANVPTAREGEP